MPHFGDLSLTPDDTHFSLFFSHRHCDGYFDGVKLQSLIKTLAPAKYEEFLKLKRTYKQVNGTGAPR